MLWSLLTGSLAVTSICAQSVEDYIATQRPIAKTKLLANIGESAGGNPGIVIASPSTDDPDYYFTWTRDSSLVFQAIIDQYTTGYDADYPESEIQGFITSEAKLQQISNPSGDVSTGGLGEPKFHVNETAFTGSWGRPQRDGPALRSTALITYANSLGEDQSTYIKDTIWPVVKLDLDYTADTWNQTTFDLWEEVSSSSFFTTAAQHRALRQGAVFAESLGEDSAQYITQADNVLCFLQTYWSPDGGYATANTGGGRSGIDSNTVLTSIHNFDAEAGCDATTFQPCSDKALSNLIVYVDAFRTEYDINAGIPENEAVATGRYTTDVYYNGNPWYLTTIAVAEQLYDALTVWKQQGSLEVTAISSSFFNRFSADIAEGTYAADSTEYAELTTAIKAFADGFISVVAKYTPEDGALAEQYDRNTGAPLSAEDLTWSYASFLTAFAAREGFVPTSWGASGLTAPGTCQSNEGEVVAVTFSVTAETSDEESIFVVGSVGALGNWSPENSVALSPDNKPVWTVTINIPENSNSVEYKYIRKVGDAITWEQDPNRSINVGTDAVSIDDVWR